MIDPSLIQPLVQGRFRFACSKALPCFTMCCANLDLALSPYDVLRLKNRIGLSSEAFLEKYTTVSINQAYGLPLVRLKMTEDELMKLACNWLRFAIFGEKTLHLHSGSLR